MIQLADVAKGREVFDLGEPIRVELDPVTRMVRVMARGEVDLLTAPTAVAMLIDALPFARRAWFDLSGVTFIDASGLRLVTTAIHHLGLERVSVLACWEPVRRVFEMTGLRAVLAPARWELGPPA